MRFQLQPVSISCLVHDEACFHKEHKFNLGWKMIGVLSQLESLMVLEDKDFVDKVDPLFHTTAMLNWKLLVQNW